MPDRLYIHSKVRKIIAKMKETNFLDADNATNKEILLYAASLGLTSPSPITGSKEGLFLEKELGPLEEALIYASVIPAANNLENVIDKSFIYDNIQNCAHTGFQIIDGIIDEYNIETLNKRMLSELDDLFQIKIPKPT